MPLTNLPAARIKLTTLAILAVAMGWKGFLLALDAFPFNADEAIVALMARHILQGKLPTFFYGQAYMGSLDAFLVAGGFALFGQQVWVIRLVQAILYIGTIITTISLGKEAFGSLRVGLVAGALLAVPVVNVTLYTTASLGGYGEALLLGNLILLCALRLNMNFQMGQMGTRWAASFGFLAGLGLWANGLTLIYSLPAAVWLVWRAAKVCQQTWLPKAGTALIAVSCFLAGSAPWWIFALTRGWQSLVGELLGNAVAVEGGSWLARTASHLVSLVLLGGTVTLGLRPPWEVRWLALPLFPLILVFWGWTVFLAARRMLQDQVARRGGLLLGGVTVVLLAGFIFTSFGVDPSGRYFVPLAVPMTLAGAVGLEQASIQRHWRNLLILLVIIFQGWGTLECASHNPPGITTQFNAITQIDTRYQDDLLQFLEGEGETRGYTNYWVAYPLAFLSQEKVIFIPRLPYHADLRYTPRDDRYSPYDEEVASSQKTAIITTLNPNLDEKIIALLKKLGVNWLYKEIGDYHIYYRLSHPVRADELNWGANP